LIISVLNPTATFSDDINQNSIVLKMTYGSVSFLFMGDANADAESRIANSGIESPGRYPQGRTPR
jgi:beta-lactamase superfamily II metal-dependent hydrolase